MTQLRMFILLHLTWEGRIPTLANIKDEIGWLMDRGYIELERGYQLTKKGKAYLESTFLILGDKI
jgi:hypothetical protein